MMPKRKRTLLFFIVAILVITSVALGELYYVKSRFHYEAHLDESVITVDGADITLRQFGYYIFEVEEFVQKQALLYDPEDPTHWWHTHFAAGLDSTFVSDYAMKTAISSCVCNEIYYQEAVKSGLELSLNEDRAAISKAKETYDKLNDYQKKVTGLDESIILEFERKEMLAKKYAAYLCINVNFTGYNGEPVKLVNWDGDYYLNEILSLHIVDKKDKLLGKITMGRITVNYE